MAWETAGAGQQNGARRATAWRSRRYSATKDEGGNTIMAETSSQVNVPPGDSGAPSSYVAYLHRMPQAWAWMHASADSPSTGAKDGERTTALARIGARHSTNSPHEVPTLCHTYARARRRLTWISSHP